MSPQIFKVTILRQIRERIIAALKFVDLEQETHYRISSAVESSSIFTITLVSSIARVQISPRMSKIHEALKEEFPTAKFEYPGQSSLRINVIDAYNDLCPKKEDTPDDTEVNVVRPRKLTRETFLKWVYWTVADKFFNGEKFDGKISKHKGNKDNACLVVPKEFFYGVIEYFLHKEIMVLPTIEKAILVYKNRIDNEREQHAYTTFITDYKSSKKLLDSLNELLRQVIFYLRSGGGGEPNLKRMTTPAELAINEMDFRVVFSLDDTELANRIAAVLSDLSLSTEKVGHIIYITVTKTLNMERIVKRWTEYQQEGVNRKIGFVVEEGRAGEEVSHLKPLLSNDYSQFHYLPFNRGIIPSHVEDLAKSIDEFGFLDLVIVARTAVVDGVLKDWIVDRQHRFEALKSRKRPIPYAIIHVHSKYELVRLIAALNSKSKKWQTKDYLHAWSSLNMEEYKIINEWKNRVPITIISQAMTGLDPRSISEKFQQGEIRFDNPEKGKKILNELLLLRNHIPKGIRYLYATTKFLHKMQQEEDFSIDALLKKIPVSGLVFDPNDRDQQIIAKLQVAYTA